MKKYDKVCRQYVQYAQMHRCDFFPFVFSDKGPKNGSILCASLSECTLFTVSSAKLKDYNSISIYAFIYSILSYLL